MAIQKQKGKGRQDRWYHLAKEKGYRARAAFKLIQLNKRYHFLEKTKVLLDLCAAPGSWCQVAAEVMAPQSLIVGVDLAPIKPIPRCITFQSDITTDKCRSTIRQHLKTWKADTVLHDGAPNVGTAWVQDAFSQAELVLQALKLATDFLIEDGTFVTKIFRSKDYNALLWVFNQLFAKVEATKPPSSRNVSAEIFVVCRGFKAPKHIDPKFLDSKSVFAEVAAPTPNNEAKVFNPEKKKRKREGYEEGDWTQHKEAPASEFIQTTDPIAMLGSLNKLSFEQKPNGDLALAALDKLPETTKEIRTCCADLKVLGRKEFKLLLRWRLKVRDVFGWSAKKKATEAVEGEEVAEIEPMDEEMRIQEEMQRLQDQDTSRKKKDRRKDNDRKQRDIVRIQMNMTTPMEIGMEQAGPFGEDSMFSLKAVDKAGALGRVTKGKMHIIKHEVKQDNETEFDAESDDAEDQLERELDTMYDRYQERKSDSDAKYRAKKARKAKEDDAEFDGFSDPGQGSEEELVSHGDSETSDDDQEEEPEGLIKSLDSTVDPQNGLTRRAALFFDQDIFRDIEGLDGDDGSNSDSGIGMNEEPEVSSELDVKSTPSQPLPLSDLRVPIRAESEQPDVNLHRDNGKDSSHRNTKAWIEEEQNKEERSGFEIVKRSVNQWEAESEPTKNGRPDIDIITAEAMTLAQQLASGEKSKQDLIDDGFNKYSFRDVDGLPDWFLDDEDRHSKLQRPTTAAAAAAIKEKLRALNARPIKKVREAKARKKFKAAQRLEKLKKKSATIAEEEGGLTERDKANQITKLMSKAGKKRPKQVVKVVVARGGNRGISGRPRGTKGKYKMVDARMRKDVRAAKRLAKKSR